MIRSGLPSPPHPSCRVVSDPNPLHRHLVIARRLLADCGADVCEAVTPYPMTKVDISEYYDTWCRPEKLTIWGGIPESVLLEKSASDEEFETYLDHLFKAIAPGKRFIAGIGDTTPPGAKFERLIRIGERLEKEGRLPLQAGGAVLLSAEQLARAPQAGGAPSAKTN